MSASLSDLRNLGRRVELLEKQNRRLRVTVVLAILLAGAILVAQQVPASLAQQERDTTGKDRLIVRDSNGHHRAWLGMGADGAPGLFFADPERKSSALLTLGQGGLILRLSGNGDTPVAGICVQPDGVAVAVMGPEGKPAIGVNALRTDSGNVFPARVQEEKARP